MATRRKLTIACMLTSIAMVVVVLTGYLWVTWPERVMQQFGDEFASKKWEWGRSKRTVRTIGLPHYVGGATVRDLDLRLFHAGSGTHIGPVSAEVEMLPRTLMDYLTGTLRFRVNFRDDKAGLLFANESPVARLVIDLGRVRAEEMTDGEIEEWKDLKYPRRVEQREWLEQLRRRRVAQSAQKNSM